jgi:hypothetical protein
VETTGRRRSRHRSGELLALMQPEAALAAPRSGEENGAEGGGDSGFIGVGAGGGGLEGGRAAAPRPCGACRQPAATRC